MMAVFSSTLYSAFSVL